MGIFERENLLPNLDTLQNICILIIIAYTLFGWLVAVGIKIGYGRLKNRWLKLEFPPRISWFLFEVPNLIWALYFLFYLGDSLTAGYALFIIHYINRDIIYPLRMKTTNKVPIEIMLAATSFTFANGYIQGLSNQVNTQGDGSNLFFRIIGFVIFFVGMGINIKSDQILQNHQSKPKDKKDESTGIASKHKYVLINQFLFKYVSNPNYLGEIIQWFGYFLVCQNLYSFLFFFSTLNILVAAAIPRNKWNKKNIAGYPENRKAVIPFVI